MRKLTKEMFSFSGAMAAFGVGRLVELLDPRQWLQPNPQDDTAAALGAVASAAEGQTSGPLRDAFKTVDRLQQNAVDMMFDAIPGTGGASQTASAPESPDPAGDTVSQDSPEPASPAEEVLVLFSNAAENLIIVPDIFEPDGRPYFRLRGGLGNQEGTISGRFDAVFGAAYATFHDFILYPLPEEEPQEPFDKPPFYPWNPEINWAKAKWTIDGRGALMGVGINFNRSVVQRKTGINLLEHGTTFFITGGTGAFKQTRGMATSISGVDITKPPLPGIPNPDYYVHTMRLVHDSEAHPQAVQVPLPTGEAT